ncbi:hypothetical protein GPECTOR_48g447 [Gonium pectorale]|uniref:Uncharacterized protein n=1 Tax=Gonium pectorale TaxID=33097 RepID=A0A150G857_GONPE|nr:hypothetical protein GPECTOR_48g447 [Gonium pectorale]|eukprot:KXZ46014.1 hypothetical protein GPECTOR_48g447 [Gonium pectorale]
MHYADALRREASAAAESLEEGLLAELVRQSLPALEELRQRERNGQSAAGGGGGMGPRR